MKSQKIPLHPGTTTNNRKWESFDIFVGYDNEPIISIHLPNTTLKHGSASHYIAVESDNNGIQVDALNGLCEKLFSETNSILYRDSPERRFNVYDTEELLPPSQNVSEHVSSISESQPMSIPLNSTRDPKLGRTPRREVWWRLHTIASNGSLDSIAQQFEDYIYCFLSPSSDSLLRRIKAPTDPYHSRTYYLCPGYLREEITLTPDVSRCAIIFHEYPSQSELCSGCGQLVQYE